MKVYIEILGLSIPSYGLMIVIGVVLANVIAFLMIHTSQDNKSELDYNNFFIVEAYCILGGFAGAKLLYILISFRQINWHELWTLSGFNMFMQTGFVFYGGFIGGIIAVILSGRIHNICIKLYINEFIILIPLVHGFGRIGCFMAGCCYGMPYNGIGAVTYPENSFAISGIKLFPVQIVEAMGLFFIFGIMLLLKIRYKSKHMAELYCLLYSVCRFVLEFYRYDAIRGRWWLLSTSQWISILMVVVVVSYLMAKKTPAICLFKQRG